MPLALSPKEKHLARLLKSDLQPSMAAIAEEIGLSVVTTKAMAVQLYKAFGVEDRQQFFLFFNLPLNHPRVEYWIQN
jgi:DNA-binding NarL/FixJ family response regulator